MTYKELVELLGGALEMSEEDLQAFMSSSDNDWEAEAPPGCYPIVLLDLQSYLVLAAE